MSMCGGYCSSVVVGLAAGRARRFRLRFLMKWVGTTRPALGSRDFLGALLLSGKHFQSVAADAVVVPGEKLGLQHIPCTICLLGTQDMQANRSGSQIGQLQPFRIGLLVGDQNAQWKWASRTIRSVAHPSELQLQSLILLRASRLAPRRQPMSPDQAVA